MLAPLSLLVSLLSVIHGDDSSFLCSEEFCKNDVANSPCINLPDGCNETEDGIIVGGLPVLAPRVCNCCRYCLSYLKVNDSCVHDNPGLVTPWMICGHGLTCSSERKCVRINDTECMRAQLKYDENEKEGTLGIWQWRPTCEAVGDYGPVHCIPGSICYCIEPQNGTRIFGEIQYTSQQVVDKMLCECSRAAWKASLLPWDVEVARCAADGSYDTLQCVGDNCACVSHIDGTMAEETFVDLRDMTIGYPPCFDPTQHRPGTYERKCEQLVLQKKKMEKEGFTVLNMLIPECTPDGRYARTQTTADHRSICVDPEGEQIGQFGTSCGTTDCNCARTFWLLKQAGDVETPTCCPDGSFRAWQCRRGDCFCVDHMGNQASLEVEFSKVKELTCYNVTSCANTETC